MHVKHIFLAEVNLTFDISDGCTFDTSCMYVCICMCLHTHRDTHAHVKTHINPSESISVSVSVSLCSRPVLIFLRFNRLSVFSPRNFFLLPVTIKDYPNSPSVCGRKCWTHTDIRHASQQARIREGDVARKLIQSGPAEVARRRQWTDN